MKVGDKMDIIQAQNDFYKKFYDVHNDVSVSSEYQKVRYEKISNMFKDDDNFTIHDIGMGLGGFLQYLNKNFIHKNYEYSGTEINQEFYNICECKYPNNKFYLRDIMQDKCEDRYDYLVMNAIFNTKGNVSITKWEEYIFKLIKQAYDMANKGIAFNILTEFCDFYERDLYYCNIFKMLNYINDNLSRFFEVQHSYPLYEVTIFVYKPNFIMKNYNEEQFKKYFK